MIRHLHCGLLGILLLAACDQRQDARRSADGTAATAPPVVTKSSRPAPGESGGEASVEPQVAFEKALEIEAPAPRDKALAEIAWSALERDPELARQAFAALSIESSERLRLIQHFAMRLAEQDPAEALAWADTLGSDKEIAAAKGRIALVLAESDPPRAAALLSESGIEGRELDVAVVQVIQRWAASSPSGAAAWVAAFPPGEAREAGLRTTLSQWLKVDAPAAFSWMTALEDETLRKDGALALAETLVQQPKEQRDQWLALADSRTRAEIERETARALENMGSSAHPDTQ